MSLGARLYAELRGDRAIWAIIVLLAIFSILAVYSSTGTLAYRERGGNTEAFLIKHMIILAGGLFLTYLFHLLYYMKYSRMANSFEVSSMRSSPLNTWREDGSKIRSATLSTGDFVSDLRRSSARTLARSSSKENGLAR